MVIYGLTLLGACMMAGTFLGYLLGWVLGIDSNIGGVGFAMLFLVIAAQKLMDKDQLSKAAQSGIQFWSAMYIPVVIAMCMRQNVVAALDGGAVAFIAGIGTVIAGFLLIRPISALGKSTKNTQDKTELAQG